MSIVGMRRRTCAFARGLKSLIGFWRGMGWCALTFIAAVGVGVLASWNVSEVIRAGGVGCQVIGITCVALGLENTRRIFGRHPASELVRRWFREVFGKPRSVVLEPHSAVHGHTSAGAKLSIWANAGPSASLEDRVYIIERNLDSLRQEVQEDKTYLQERIEKLRSDLKQESNARQEQSKEIKQSLEESVIGGIHLEATGLTALIVGTLSAGIPEAVAAVLAVTFQGL